MDLDTLCAVDERGRNAHDEMDCVEKLFSASGRDTLEPDECVDADFTDARVDLDLLFELRSEVSAAKASASRPGKSGVLMTLCVKSETRLSLMHVIWHLLQGVDHFFICDNAARGSSALGTVAQPLISSGLVTVRKYSEVAPQIRCYDDGLRFARKRGYEWQGALDADEFLMLPPEFQSAEAALNAFAALPMNSLRGRRKVVAGIAFNWLMQPSFDQLSVRYPEDLHVTPAEKLNFSLGVPDAHVKSFAKVSLTRSWSVHLPRRFYHPDATVINTRGVEVNSPEEFLRTTPAVRGGAILHFRFRTMQELAAKRERGRADFDCERSRNAKKKGCVDITEPRASKRRVSDIAREYVRFSKTNSTRGVRHDLRQLAERVRRVLAIRPTTTSPP